LNPRERVLRVLNHQAADRMPLTLDVGGGAGIGGPYLRLFTSKTHSEEPAEYFNYDIRTVDAPLTASANDFSQYHAAVPTGATFDEFGVGHIISETFPLGQYLHPWGLFTSPKQVLDYPLPTFHLQKNTVQQIQSLHDRGYAVSAAAGSINEWCYYLRGMEAFMVDLVQNQDLAEITLERVTRLVTQMGIQLADSGVDILCFYGDVGGQSAMLMSPSMWRRWIRLRWDAIFRSVRRVNRKVKIFVHSCGYIEPIIPDFIELGLDILNPIQPETMDPVKIKRRYGAQLSLWGGIGLQRTMTSLDPNTVRVETRQLLSTWSIEGGAIVTVTNSLPIDIPWENVLALVETIKEFRYPTE
jgi:uroporphyrinogen decarboxylase